MGNSHLRTGHHRAAKVARVMAALAVALCACLGLGAGAAEPPPKADTPVGEKDTSPEKTDPQNQPPADQPAKQTQPAADPAQSGTEKTDPAKQPAIEYPTWDDDAQKTPEEPEATPQGSKPAIEYPEWDGTDAPKVTDARVKAAIERGVAYLRGTQSDDGLFRGMYFRSYPLGETALALLAMRYAGVGITDQVYQKGQKALLERDSAKTYVVSLMAQVLSMVPRDKQTPDARRRMSALSRFLCGSQVANGMWTYQPVTTDRRKAAVSVLWRGDNSNTQFAVLGLWQLSEAGIEPVVRVLRRCEKHFLETQLADSGWGYTPPRTLVSGGVRRVITSRSTASMTATGLATMHIFEDLLHLREGGPCRTRRLPQGGRNPHMARRIEAAMDKAEKDLAAYVARHDQLRRQQAARGSRAAVRRTLSMRDLYYLYSVERVGAASGRKYFGSVDWYTAGARVILAAQGDDGSWGSGRTVVVPGRQQPEVHPGIVETALAILFLAKGRSPVFLNKLRWDGDWNNDRRDVANATRYATKALEQHFNWQTIDIDSDVAGWFDAPALVMSGTEPPEFTDTQKKRLAEYVRRGGCLLASACCRRTKFVEAVKALGTELWPDLAWQKLPADHPLLTRKSHFDLAKRPDLWGLADKQGFTFLIVTADDLSCLWHQNLLLTEEKAFKFAINLFLSLIHI